MDMYVGITLIWTKISTGGVGLHFFSSGQGLVAGCCEQGDEFEVM